MYYIILIGSYYYIYIDILNYTIIIYVIGPRNLATYIYIYIIYSIKIFESISI